MAAPIPLSRTVSITYLWKPLPNTFVQAIDHMGEMGSALQLTYDHTLDRTASAHHIERCLGRERLAGEEVRYLLEQTEIDCYGRCDQRYQYKSNYVSIR
jgi:hypothetical protein